MLVISRKREESVTVGTEDGDITFAVLGHDRGVYKVGVEAPLHCAISRSEVVKTIPREPSVIARAPEVSPDGRTLTWRTGRTVMIIRIAADGEVTTEVISSRSC